MTAKLLPSGAMPFSPRSRTHTLAVICCLTYFYLQNWGQNPGSFLGKPCKCSATRPRPHASALPLGHAPSSSGPPGRPHPLLDHSQEEQNRGWRREMLPCPPTKGFSLPESPELRLSSYLWVAFLALSSKIGTQPSSCFLLSPKLLSHP